MSTSIMAGSKLEYSVDDGTTYVEVLGIQEMPEFKEEKGEREVTTVRDTVRQYDNEMDSPTEQTLSAYYIKSDSDQLAFRTLARNNGSCKIRVTYSDGDSLELDAKLKNYGINAGDAPSSKMWSCVIRRASDITFTESAS
uniref:hypothetical protein n=1 Tax=Ningiella ruwaisensis TaxID=2364274 RepID=UPI00109FD503|nr:hypothetical protein [Ningiella ruwaisensis]